LGSLEGFEETQRKLLADRIEEILVSGKNLLFNDIPLEIEKKARYFSDIIVKQGIYTSLQEDKKTTSNRQESAYVEVDINSLENRDVQEIGAEWIVKQTMDKVGVQDLLSSLGMDNKDITLSYINWISRSVHPLSELGTEKWLKRNTGLCELLGIKEGKVSRHQLYYISRELYRHKEAIEKHFCEKTRELFNLEDKIILYDLTNSYFEGRMMSSKKARFGRSKEKRNDCKLIVLALVTNSQGFIRYSKIYRGNMADCNTLTATIEQLENNACADRKPTVVLDAGIATQDNLQMLKSKKYQYVCISRTALKEYQLQSDSSCIIIDKNKQVIEIKKVKQEKNEDVYLYVKSPSKQKKEASIDEKLSMRFEQGLEAIRESLTKKTGVKTIEKVYERIGRLKSKYPRVSGSYSIKTRENQGKIYHIDWRRKPKKAPEETGIYFIRTSYAKQTQEEIIWNVYNCIREIESSFRCLKTELCIRPNYHQKDTNIEAHIHLGLLAYQIVSIIRYQLKQSGINDSWKTLLSKMNTQKIMTTSFMDKHNNKVHVRNCSVPNAELTEIQQTLKLKPAPFYRKKVVVPQK
jgi:transposase